MRSTRESGLTGAPGTYDSPVFPVTPVSATAALNRLRIGPKLSLANCRATSAGRTAGVAGSMRHVIWIVIHDSELARVQVARHEGQDTRRQRCAVVQAQHHALLIAECPARARITDFRAVGHQIASTAAKRQPKPRGLRGGSVHIRATDVVIHVGGAHHRFFHWLVVADPLAYLKRQRLERSAGNQNVLRSAVQVPEERAVTHATSQQQPHRHTHGDPAHTLRAWCVEGPFSTHATSQLGHLANSDPGP
jgi:hypothetical protein